MLRSFFLFCCFLNNNVLVLVQSWTPNGLLWSQSQCSEFLIMSFLSYNTNSTSHSGNSHLSENLTDLRWRDKIPVGSKHVVPDVITLKHGKRCAVRPRCMAGNLWSLSPSGGGNGNGGARLTVTGLVSTSLMYSATVMGPVDLILEVRCRSMEGRGFASSAAELYCSLGNRGMGALHPAVWVTVAVTHNMMRHFGVFNETLKRVWFFVFLFFLIVIQLV